MIDKLSGMRKENRQKKNKIPERTGPNSQSLKNIDTPRPPNGLQTSKTRIYYNQIKIDSRFLNFGSNLDTIETDVIKFN